MRVIEEKKNVARGERRKESMHLLHISLSLIFPSLFFYLLAALCVDTPPPVISLKDMCSLQIVQKGINYMTKKVPKDLQQYIIRYLLSLLPFLSPFLSLPSPPLSLIFLPSYLSLFDLSFSPLCFSLYFIAWILN